MPAFFVLGEKLGYYCMTHEMYCTKCGEDNLGTAKFCRNCGESFGAEQETHVAVRRDARASGHEGFENAEEETRVAARRDVETLGRGDAETVTEKDIFSISPTLVFVKMGYVVAAFGALLLVAVTSAFTSISAGWAVLLGLLLFLIPAFYHFRRKLLRYTLTDAILQIDSGFIARTTRNVPITRIQDVTVSASPWQRLLGIGDLIVDNASEQGGKLTLKNINSPKKYADELLLQMRLLDR